LNSGGGGSTQGLITDLSEAINEVNFDTDEDCEELQPVAPGGECLSLGGSEDEENIAQLFDICEQLEVALRYLTSPAGEDLSPTEALDQIEDAVLDASPAAVDRVVEGLFNCFEEALLPLLFPSMSSEEEGIQNPIVQQNTLQNHANESQMTEQSQPEREQLSIISQEERIQEQFENLKQLLLSK
jgi:hypothetical protein